jgi:hypothetical protein
MNSVLFLSFFQLSFSLFLSHVLSFYRPFFLLHLFSSAEQSIIGAVNRNRTAELGHMEA